MVEVEMRSGWEVGEMKRRDEEGGAGVVTPRDFRMESCPWCGVV